MTCLPLCIIFFICLSLIWKIQKDFVFDKIYEKSKIVLFSCCFLFLSLHVWCGILGCLDPPIVSLSMWLGHLVIIIDAENDLNHCLYGVVSKLICILIRLCIYANIAQMHEFIWMFDFSCIFEFGEAFLSQSCHLCVSRLKEKCACNNRSPWGFKIGKNDEWFTGNGCKSSKLTRCESHRLKEPKRKCIMWRKGPIRFSLSWER